MAYERLSATEQLDAGRRPAYATRRSSRNPADATLLGAIGIPPKLLSTIIFLFPQLGAYLDFTPLSPPTPHPLLPPLPAPPPPTPHTPCCCCYATERTSCSRAARFRAGAPRGSSAEAPWKLSSSTATQHAAETIT